MQYLIPVYKCDFVVMFPAIHPKLQITLNYEDLVLSRLEKIQYFFLMAQRLNSLNRLNSLINNSVKTKIEDLDVK